MQKKLIALAVAGLASTAAFAQTNVQIYGSLDFGYSYRFDDRTLDARVPAGTGKSSSRFDGGQSAGNRIGFKGTEDLGNGLKAVFLVEQGLGLDQNSQGQYENNSINFTRQAYVGLTGNFGTAIGGRLYTPHYTFTAAMDPFAGGTVGQARNVFGGLELQQYTGQSLTDPVRVDNAIAYVSPSFGGFTVTGAFSNNAFANDSQNNSARNNTVYAVLGQYNNGPIAAGLGYHYVAPGSYNNAPATGATVQQNTLAAIIPFTKDVQNIVLGGSYDFKVVKVSLLGDWNKISFENNFGTNLRVSNYMIGATAPIGKFDILGSYTYSDGNAQIGGDAQQLALGMKYNLSKRTNVYSVYSWIDNTGSDRIAATGDAGNSGYASAAAGTLAAPVSPVAWQQGFQIGVRHQF